MSPLDHPIALAAIFSCAVLLAVLVIAWIVKFTAASRDHAAERWDPNTARCEGCDRSVRRYTLTPIESGRGVWYYCGRCTGEIRALRGRAS